MYFGKLLPSTVDLHRCCVDASVCAWTYVTVSCCSSPLGSLMFKRHEACKEVSLKGSKSSLLRVLLARSAFPSNLCTTFCSSKTIFDANLYFSSSKLLGPPPPGLHGYWRNCGNHHILLESDPRIACIQATRSGAPSRRMNLPKQRPLQNELLVAPAGGTHAHGGAAAKA